jgi:undecaprenyl-diphosphatase
MTSLADDEARADVPDSIGSSLDVRPPGERYYRHPGDVVRLVLWGSATVLLALVIWLAPSTMDGVTDDLGRASARVPKAARQLALALAQVLAVLVPVSIAGVLVVQQRWRRLLVAAGAGLAGAGVFVLFDARLDLPGRLPSAVDSGTWLASTSFPSAAYVAGLAAASTVGKPWLSRSWRRAADITVAALALVILVAGTAGAPSLLLALATGAAVGAAALVIFGAPNRQPSPAAVASALRAAGLDVTRLRVQRATGGRSQLYVVDRVDGTPAFAKVYARDSRDADVLFRGYRAAVLRSADDEWPSLSLRHDVEHQAFLLILAARAGVNCPGVQLLTRLPDGSMVLVMDHVDGVPLDSDDIADVDADLLTAVWREARTLHDHRLAHRGLRAANILVNGGRPVVIDLGAGVESASPRLRAVDRAELLASLAVLVGPERAITSAAATLDGDDLASTMPFLQPLGLSAATRKRTSKSMLRELRSGVAAATGQQEAPLERLVRVRPRTLVMIAALVGAFYVLLPQLANVGDSFQALGSANWAWIVAAAALSIVTYVGAAISTIGSVPDPLPFGPTLQAQMASSFVNRVTPANVGGMALNVRYLQKAGVESSQAVTGVALNSVVGAVVHVMLLVLFFAWAGRSSSAAFKIPADSKTLVIIAVVLALAGMVIATRRGRRLVKTHVVRFVKQSIRSLATLARSPSKLAALFGGSAVVTLAYIAALAASVAAFHGDVSFAEIGAVYLGASLLAAVAPTPGGLGALEAAAVAGFTGVGVESGVAVAAVLAYRLVTYWLPIVPGWIAFRLLDRRGLI